MATYNNDANSYGFSSPSTLYPPISSSPYSSTPSSLRPPRPRFGYSGPTSYPRPRSSASKPNPDSPMDSMANNYGSSSGSLLSSGTRPLDDTYESDSSKYYSTNEAGFDGNDPLNYNKPDLSTQYPVSNYREGNSLLGQRENNDYQAPNYYDRFQKSSNNYQPLGQTAGYPPAANFQSDSNKPYFDKFGNKPILSNPNFNKLEFNNPTFNKPDFSKPAFSTFNKPNYFKSNFNKFNSNKTNKPFNTPFSSQRFGKPKKRMAERGTWHCEVCSMDFNSDAPLQMHLNGARHAKKLKTLEGATATAIQNQGSKAQWHCQVCSIDFTSQVTLDMHLNGAKHAKKLKAKDTSTTLQNKGTTQVENKPGKELFCAVCNIQANSGLQLQMHLDGTKHKNKLKGDSDSKPGTKSELNGNGSVTRSLPSDFDEQPAKLMKFSCDICNISVNSNVQLQQHLTSKKHQAKVEGKPILKGKKKRAAAAGENNETTDEPVAEAMETNQTDVKVVKGVQDLATSFVQGETIKP